MKTATDSSLPKVVCSVDDNHYKELKAIGKYLPETFFFWAFSGTTSIQISCKSWAKFEIWPPKSGQLLSVT
jgi:hypothetical protein